MIENVKISFRGGGLFGGEGAYSGGGGLNERGAYKIMQKSSVQNNKNNDFNTTKHNIYIFSKSNKNKHYIDLNITIAFFVLVYDRL